MARNMTAEQKKWQAQDDAHTLASANEIKSDPARMKAAAAEASKMQAEAQKRANSLKSIAKVKTTQNTRTPAKQNTRTQGRKK